MGIRRLGRPTGYNFPVGLSGSPANTVVDYLVIAGGGVAQPQVVLVEVQVVF